MKRRENYFWSFLDWNNPRRPLVERKAREDLSASTLAGPSWTTYTYQNTAAILELCKNEIETPQVIWITSRFAFFYDIVWRPSETRRKSNLYLSYALLFIRDVGRYWNVHRLQKNSINGTTINSLTTYRIQGCSLSGQILDVCKWQTHRRQHRATASSPPSSTTSSTPTAARHGNFE